MEVFAPEYNENGRFDLVLSDDISDGDRKTLRRILSTYGISLKTKTNDSLNSTHTILANP